MGRDVGKGLERRPRPPTPQVGRFLEPTQFTSPILLDFREAPRIAGLIRILGRW